MTVPLYTAIGVTAAWVLLVLLGIHYTIQEDGSWYNQLKLNDDLTYNYRSKAKITVTRRLDLHRLLAMLLGGIVIAYVVTYIFVTGLLEVLPV